MVWRGFGEIEIITLNLENPRYTAHIKLPNVEKIEAFTNLTAVSINEYMPEGQEIDEDDIEYAYPKKTVPSKASNRKSGGSEKKKGATTFDNLMDNGGTIIDKKPTQRGTFSSALLLH